MDVRMIHEVLTPGVQNADAPYPCTEMFWILCEFHERFGGRTEKKIIHDLAIHGYQEIQF
jgi:hypothetical protein